MTTLSRTLELLFGCHHRDLSRVFTINKRTYQVCFDCAREIDYSWDRMGLEPDAPANCPELLDNKNSAQASVT